jgi:hypothetical protein
MLAVINWKKDLTYYAEFEPVDETVYRIFTGTIRNGDDGAGDDMPRTMRHEAESHRPRGRRETPSPVRAKAGASSSIGTRAGHRNPDSRAAALASGTDPDRFPTAATAVVAVLAEAGAALAKIKSVGI